MSRLSLSATHPACQRLVRARSRNLPTHPCHCHDLVHSDHEPKAGTRRSSYGEAGPTCGVILGEAVDNTREAAAVSVADHMGTTSARPKWYEANVRKRRLSDMFSKLKYINHRSNNQQKPKKKFGKKRPHRNDRPAHFRPRNLDRKWHGFHEKTQLPGKKRQTVYPVNHTPFGWRSLRRSIWATGGCHPALRDPGHSPLRRAIQIATRVREPDFLG